MQEETKERWKELCEQAATEQNPEKFAAIITELNDVLEQKDLRLKEARKPSGEQPAK